MRDYVIYKRKMLQERRQNEIIQILQRKEEIRVSEISKLFGVSQNTIRRDLEELEKRGLVKKVYGGRNSPHLIFPIELEKVL